MVWRRVRKGKGVKNERRKGRKTEEIEKISDIAAL